MQDRVLADGTFVPAGSISASATVKQRLQEAPHSPPRSAPDHVGQAAHRADTHPASVTTPIAERSGATVELGLEPASTPNFTGRDDAAPTARRRLPAVPPTAPQVDPVTNTQLEQLVDFMQSHRHELTAMTGHA